MVDDLLLDALVLELCRLAAAQAPASLARFPGECLSELISRCGDHLSQHAFGLQMWSRELSAPSGAALPHLPGENIEFCGLFLPGGLVQHVLLHLEREAALFNDPPGL